MPAHRIFTQPNTKASVARWRKLISRCTNPNDPKYHRYGGRGIKVCDRWLASYDNFCLDVGLPPFKGATLNRKNNDGNYEPSNVEWATQKRQQNNRSDNHLVTFNGFTRTLAEWADVLDIPVGTITSRLRRNWPLDKVLTSSYTRVRRNITKTIISTVH